MAKFNFRLQSFLSLKEKLEDQKKLEYGRAVAALEFEKAKLNGIIREKEGKIAEFAQLARGVVEARTFTRYGLYIEVLKKRIIDQRKEVEKAEKIAEEKRIVLVEAMRDRKAIQTVKDKAFEEFREEEKRAEQKMVDEIVSYKYANGNEEVE